MHSFRYPQMPSTVAPESDPTPRVLRAEQLRELPTDQLLEQVRLRRQNDPLTVALASRVRNLDMALTATLRELEQLRDTTEETGA